MMYRASFNAFRVCITVKLVKKDTVRALPKIRLISSHFPEDLLSEVCETSLLKGGLLAHLSLSADVLLLTCQTGSC